MPRNDLKAYTTVLARMPQELADDVKRYAAGHRWTVSALIRDGLEMRLEQDPLGRVAVTSDGRDALRQLQPVPSENPKLDQRAHSTRNLRCRRARTLSAGL
jgi:hypothetical protein